MVSKSERRYRRHRFPIEVVEQCVWLYFRFAVSYRDIEEMMAKRDIQVTYETVREWCHKFGSLYAAQLKTKRARVGMKWHMDEVFLLVASRGLEWSGHRYFGATETGPLGSSAFLSQAAPYRTQSTARHHYGQATELRCCEKNDLAQH